MQRLGEIMSLRIIHKLNTLLSLKNNIKEKILKTPDPLTSCLTEIAQIPHLFHSLRHEICLTIFYWSFQLNFWILTINAFTKHETFISKRYTLWSWILQWEETK